jgi:hypothetical protein
VNQAEPLTLNEHLQGILGSSILYFLLDFHLKSNLLRWRSEVIPVQKHKTLSEKLPKAEKKKKKIGGVVQMVQCLPSKCKGLN